MQKTGRLEKPTKKLDESEQDFENRSTRYDNDLENIMSSVMNASIYAQSSCKMNKLRVKTKCRQFVNIFNLMLRKNHFYFCTAGSTPGEMIF